MTEPRLMSGAEAAAYCGLSAAAFSGWVAAGRLPRPLPGTRRWDRKAIDAALDEASGILTPAAQEDEAQREEDAWERKYEARKAARLLDPDSIAKEPGGRPNR